MSAALSGDVSVPKPKKAAGQRKPKKAVEVNLLENLPTPAKAEAEFKSPYPEGVQYYQYDPRDGSAPIYLALSGFDRPDKVWFFDLAQLPRLAQTWAWMNHAKVPKAIQRQACSLPDAEYFAMFDEWFDVQRKLNNAGPAGAVTSGK